MSANQFKVQIIGSKDDDEHLRLSDFIDQLKSIRETLNEIDKKLAKSTTPLTDYKVVDLSHSSPSTVELEAIPIDEENNNSVQVIDRFFDGIEKINSGSAPDDFDSTLLESFANIGKGFRRRIQGIVFKRNGIDVNIGRSFEKQIRKIIGEDQIMDGSIEGSLEMINFHGGANKFNIYPIVGPQRVTCHFPKELLKDAILSVGQYINVEGKLCYKERDKYPYGLYVKSIEIYPPENELPSIFDLRGIAPDATGELSSGEFVRKIRDAKK